MWVDVFLFVLFLVSFSFSFVFSWVLAFSFDFPCVHLFFIHHYVSVYVFLVIFFSTFPVVLSFFISFFHMFSVFILHSSFLFMWVGNFQSLFFCVPLFFFSFLFTYFFKFFIQLFICGFDFHSSNYITLYFSFVILGIFLFDNARISCIFHSTLHLFSFLIALFFCGFIYSFHFLCVFFHLHSSFHVCFLIFFIPLVIFI